MPSMFVFPGHLWLHGAHQRHRPEGTGPVHQQRCGMRPGQDEGTRGRDKELRRGPDK